MFLGINSIYTPVYLPLCEYGQNQPPCADVGLLLNMDKIKQVEHPCMLVDFLKYTPRVPSGYIFPYTPLGRYTGVYI